MRALEIHYLSGVTMSQWLERHGFRETRYDVCKIGLTIERKELYERINGRVDRMLEQGWVEEVENLLKAGYDTGSKPFHSIGYREILLSLKGELSHSEMVEKIKIATRHYAKRQVTWFVKEKEINWYAYPEEKQTALEKVTRFLE